MAWWLVPALLLATALRAQTPGGGMLKGKVVNGTTGQPVPSATVEYVQLAQGMEPVEVARADAQGNFQFSKVPAPAAQAGPPGQPGQPGPPGMLRVEHGGATYSQPVLGGGMAAAAPMMQGAVSPDGAITITVYDPSSQRDLYVVHEHAIFVRPRGGTMAVLEQVFIENASSPPRAYVNPNGTFRFTLPARPAGEITVSLQGAAGMPLPQTPQPVEGLENAYTINYPIRPGESMIRVQYALDYQDPYDFSKPFDRLPEEVHVVTPGEGEVGGVKYSVQVNAEGMIPTGKDEESGFAAFKMTLAGNMVNFRVSGEAPPDQVSATPGEGGSLTAVPNPLHDQRWLLLGGLGMVLLAGFVYLYKKG